MPKSINVPIDRVNFPPACVVCLSSESRTYMIQQVYTYGRKSESVTLGVPMCEAHYEAASYKGLAERAFGCLGVTGGILAGILFVVFLLLRWEDGGGVFAKIFMSVIVGFGGFILAWWVIAVLIAPLFAASTSKEARNAVKIILVQPFDQRMVLAFRNEAMADAVESMN